MRTTHADKVAANPLPDTISILEARVILTTHRTPIIYERHGTNSLLPPHIYHYEFTSHPRCAQ